MSIEHTNRLHEIEKKYNLSKGKRKTDNYRKIIRRLSPSDICTIKNQIRKVHSSAIVAETKEQKFNLNKNNKKNNEHSNIPQHEIDSLARALLPAIQALFETEEGKREFEEWKANKQKAHLYKEISNKK